VPKQPPGDDNVGRMQFLLGLRRRGISDPAVLRAMDEAYEKHHMWAFPKLELMPSEYYRRALDSLQRTPQDAPEAHQYHGFKALKAFLRIAFRLGVLDAERREFWRFFIEALRTNNDRMTELLRHAAMAYHFRKLTESHCYS